MRWVERNLVARYAWSQWHSILEKASCFETEKEGARKAEQERERERERESERNGGWDGR